MAKRPKKLPTDTNARAFAVAQIAVGEVEVEAVPEKDPKAVSRGEKGGPARAASLSPRRRKQIAKKAAEARWGNRR